jgi:hypothetical protein
MTRRRCVVLGRGGGRNGHRSISATAHHVNLLRQAHSVLNVEQLDEDMAEPCHPNTSQSANRTRGWGLPAIAIATFAIAAGPGIAGSSRPAAPPGPPPPGSPLLPPPPLALLPERARIVRSSIVASAAASIPIWALRWWTRLRLASPAIRGMPPGRSDTPALPTVGRPRDSPGSGVLIRAGVS